MIFIGLSSFFILRTEGVVFTSTKVFAILSLNEIKYKH